MGAPIAQLDVNIIIVSDYDSKTDKYAAQFALRSGGAKQQVLYTSPYIFTSPSIAVSAMRDHIALLLGHTLHTALDTDE